jgi:recombination protein RecR
LSSWQDRSATTDPISRLVNAFRRLPGIGERTATRLTFFVLHEEEAISTELAEALLQAREKVHLCKTCCNLTDQQECRICGDARRDPSTICVVERIQDLRAIEATGDFRGTYHVLHGLISPLDGVGPDDLHLRELITRLQDRDRTRDLEEVIVATSPSVDGETTALYLQRLLEPFGIKVSRIASGVPIGGDLEYTDRVTLARAIAQRRAM